MMVVMLPSRIATPEPCGEIVDCTRLLPPVVVTGPCGVKITWPSVRFALGGGAGGGSKGGRDGAMAGEIGSAGSPALPRRRGGGTSSPVRNPRSASSGLASVARGPSSRGERSGLIARL